MIDPGADRPVYKQLADLPRQRVKTGSYSEGEMLPSAAAMARTFVVGTDTVRRALTDTRPGGRLGGPVPANEGLLAGRTAGGRGRGRHDDDGDRLVAVRALLRHGPW
jgi:hypothetical protein